MMANSTTLDQWAKQITLDDPIDPEPSTDEDRAQLDRLRAEIDAIKASGGSVELLGD